jgi:uncharacterized sulfatase
VEGQPLPVSADEARAQRRERVLTEWDSQHGPVDLHLRSICRDDLLCTAYEPSSLYAGDEGELYDLQEDPGQRHNLWDDAGRRKLRDELVADLYDHLPSRRSPPLPRGAPV